MPADRRPDDGALATVAASTDRLLIHARELAHLLNLSLRTVRRMDAAGELPAPVRLGAGRLVRWSVAHVREWIGMGCPARAEFEARWNAHHTKTPATRA